VDSASRIAISCRPYLGLLHRSPQACGFSSVELAKGTTVTAAPLHPAPSFTRACIGFSASTAFLSVAMVPLAAL
jgi:hypothetical protein